EIKDHGIKMIDLIVKLAEYQIKTEKSPGVSYPDNDDSKHSFNSASLAESEVENSDEDDEVTNNKQSYIQSMSTKDAVFKTILADKDSTLSRLPESFKNLQIDQGIEQENDEFFSVNDNTSGYSSKYRLTNHITENLIEPSMVLPKDINILTPPSLSQMTSTIAVNNPDNSQSFPDHFNDSLKSENQNAALNENQNSFALRTEDSLNDNEFGDNNKHDYDEYEDDEANISDEDEYDENDNNSSLPATQNNGDSDTEDEQADELSVAERIRHHFNIFGSQTPAPNNTTTNNKAQKEKKNTTKSTDAKNNLQGAAQKEKKAVEATHQSNSASTASRLISAQALNKPTSTAVEKHEQKLKPSSKKSHTIAMLQHEPLKIKTTKQIQNETKGGSKIGKESTQNPPDTKKSPLKSSKKAKPLPSNSKLDKSNKEKQLIEATVCGLENTVSAEFDKKSNDEISTTLTNLEPVVHLINNSVNQSSDLDPHPIVSTETSNSGASSNTYVALDPETSQISIDDGKLPVVENKETADQTANPTPQIKDEVNTQTNTNSNFSSHVNAVQASQENPPNTFSDFQQNVISGANGIPAQLTAPLAVPPFNRIQELNTLYVSIKSAYFALQNLHNMSSDNGIAFNSINSSSIGKSNHQSASYEPIKYEFESASDVLASFRNMYKNLFLESERHLLDICSYFALNNLDICGSFVIDPPSEKLKYTYSEMFSSKLRNSMFSDQNTPIYNAFDADSTIKYSQPSANMYSTAFGNNFNSPENVFNNNQSIVCPKPFGVNKQLPPQSLGLGDLPIHPHTDASLNQNYLYNKSQGGSPLFINSTLSSPPPFAMTNPVMLNKQVTNFHFDSSSSSPLYFAQNSMYSSHQRNVSRNSNPGFASTAFNNQGFESAANSAYILPNTKPELLGNYPLGAPKIPQNDGWTYNNHNGSTNVNDVNHGYSYQMNGLHCPSYPKNSDLDPSKTTKVPSQDIFYPQNSVRNGLPFHQMPNGFKNQVPVNFEYEMPLANKNINGMYGSGFNGLGYHGKRNDVSSQKHATELSNIYHI
ncbi:hypothetical protein BB560_005063, partial [Smittium megazygosporum]